MALKKCRKYNAAAIFGVVAILSVLPSCSARAGSSSGPGGSRTDTDNTGRQTTENTTTSAQCEAICQPGATGPTGENGDAGPTGAPGFINGSRIRARALISEDGLVAKPYGAYRDTLRNEDCYFSTAADDVLRCLPWSSGAQVYFFSDAGCTQRVAFYASLCAAPPNAYLSEPATTCGGSVRIRIYQVGSEIAAMTPVYQGSPGSCSIHTKANGWRFFAVGSEISPNEFASATIEIQ